jgi:hypothetical protein
VIYAEQKLLTSVAELPHVSSKPNTYFVPEDE